MRWLLPWLLSGGCLLQNLSPTEQFRDSVLQFNDDLRWQRPDAAVAFVDAAYRKKFQQAHHQWGERIVIADMEVQSIKLVGNRDKGHSVVSYSWYSQSSMTLRRTVVAQRWRKQRRAFSLAEEKVTQGDATLFAAAAADR